MICFRIQSGKKNSHFGTENPFCNQSAGGLRHTQPGEPALRKDFLGILLASPYHSGGRSEVMNRENLFTRPADQITVVVTAVLSLTILGWLIRLI